MCFEIKLDIKKTNTIFEKINIELRNVRIGLEFGRAYCDDAFLGKELVPIMDEMVGYQMLEEIKSAVSFIRILWFL